MSDFEPIVGRYLAVDIEGAQHRVHVEEAGRGVPLLCLHTAGADSRQYRHVLNDAEITGRSRPSLSQTARIIARYLWVVSRYFFSHQPSAGVERP